MPLTHPSRPAAWLLPLAALALLVPIAWPTSETGPRAVDPRGELWPEEQRVVELFERASPSVVFIDRFQNLARNPFVRSDVTEVQTGTGSGFFWDEDGHVVTNFHVVYGADKMRVTLSNQSSYEAVLVGIYPDKDIAVLRVDAPSELLRPLPIGSSRELRVGQTVFAIGNPFGLDHSLSTGIVSALDREMASITGRNVQGVIQTDAAINPGNSGGPLLDSAGRLLGMNTMIVSSSGSSAGVGFAVPVDEINRVVWQLIENGRYVRPGLGIKVPLNNDAVVRNLRRQGVLVANVIDGGSAEEAGLRPTYRTREGDIVLGDIIVAIDGEATPTHEDLQDTLDRYEIGETVLVTVERDGERLELPVQLQGLDE